MPDAPIPLRIRFLKTVVVASLTNDLHAREANLAAAHIRRRDARRRTAG
jgi:hypothetical protein